MHVVVEQRRSTGVSNTKLNSNGFRRLAGVFLGLLMFDIVNRKRNLCSNTAKQTKSVRHVACGLLLSGLGREAALNIFSVFAK